MRPASNLERFSITADASSRVNVNEKRSRVRRLAEAAPRYAPQIAARQGAQSATWRVRTASPLPAEPVADGLAHDQLLVGLRNPVDLLEMRDALPPGAWHLGDVGAPEQPARTEGLIHGAIVLV